MRTIRSRGFAKEGSTGAAEIKTAKLAIAIAVATLEAEINFIFQRKGKLSLNNGLLLCSYAERIRVALDVKVSVFYGMMRS